MVNRDNYKLVKGFLDYRTRIMQNDHKTVRSAWGCLKHMLQWADSTPFYKAPRIHRTFPEYLLTARNDGRQDQLSPGRMKKTLAFARDFFEWARREYPRQYRQISELWIHSLQVRRSHNEQSRLRTISQLWTLSDALQVLQYQTPYLRRKRDKAALAFIFLSGIRGGAFVTLPIEAVDIPNRRVYQLPRLGVKTKNSKAAITHLLPIQELLDVVEEWDKFVRSRAKSPHLAWYPRLDYEGMDLDATDEINGKHSADSRRTKLYSGLRELCELSGVPFKSPHKLRHGNAVYALKRSKTVAELKAVSQNLMHSSLAITDGVYGNLLTEDVGSIIASLKP